MFSLIKATIFAALVANPAAVFAGVIEDTVATVNGQPILLSEFQKELDSAIEQFKRNAPAFMAEKDAVNQLRQKVLDQLVDHQLLQQEAEKRKFKVHDRELDNGVAEIKERNFRHDEGGKTLSDPEVESALAKELKKEGLSEAQFRERVRKQLLIRKIIEDAVRPKVKQPGDDDLKKAYDKVKFIVKGDTKTISGMADDEAQAYLALGNRVKDLTSERVRVSHILVKLPPQPSMVEQTAALKRAQELKKKLDDGEDFSDLAKKVSDDAESASRGGDLGFILRGWMPAEFEKVAFATGVGEVSQPIQTQFGYHIVRVQEKKAAEGVSMEKLKDDLAQFLYNLSFQSELDKLVKSLRSTAQIETHLPAEKKEKDKG